MNQPKENRAEPSSEPQDAKAAAAQADQAAANKSQSAANESQAGSLGQGQGQDTGMGGNPSE